MIGALPLITLLPVAYFKLPESVPWLVAKGQIDRARAVSERTGLPLPESVPPSAKAERVGFAGLFSRAFWFATVLTGLMSALAQGLNYFLNTWLPVLMEQAGFNAKGSLAFLLVLSGGAIVGALAASRFADRLGPKPVVAICFLIGGVFITLMTFDLPLPVRLAFVAVVGLGTTGTSLLIYGLVANQFPTKMRGAAVAWAAGFGRLGGVSGPLLGGFVARRRSRGEFHLLHSDRPGRPRCHPDPAGATRAPRADIHSTPVEPTVPVEAGTPKASPTS